MYMYCISFSAASTNLVDKNYIQRYSAKNYNDAFEWHADNFRTTKYQTAEAVVTFGQACGYLPSRRAAPPLGRYQVVLLCDRGT